MNISKRITRRALVVLGVYIPLVDFAVRCVFKLQILMIIIRTLYL